MESLTLEKEFRFYADLHKFGILKSYYESQFSSSCNDTEKVSQLADLKVLELASDPFLLDSTYRTVWSRVADLLP